MRLENDLYTIYGDLLVKKGEGINSTVITRIRSMGNKHRQVRVLLRNTDLFLDFEKIFEDARYATIFTPPVSKKEVCAVAGGLDIENDLLLELAMMKRNLPYTYKHVLIVAGLVIKLSLIYKPGEYDREIITHCGFTHDIGKMRIPISILNKVEKLTEAERKIIETHPVAGYILLNYYLKSDRRECSLASLDHHERLDGSGYPKGIKKITRYTQLISPVDVMDALMTKRPYRKKAYSLRATLDYLLQEANSKRLNKDVVLTLISLARKDKPDIQSMRISDKARDKLPEELTHDKYK